MDRERMPTSRPIDPSDCLVTSLIQKAVQCGEQVALSTIDESVTYAELLDRVSGLADALPNTSNQSDGKLPVAVVVDRSIASVVAIMAVRWAGLPVLPIADSEPRNRIDQVLKQTRPQLVIDATGKMQSSLVGQKVLRSKGITTATRRIPARRSAPDDIATIFFTSGSTGLPKLVARTNRVASKTWGNWNHPRLLGNWKHAISFSPLNFAGGYLFGIMMPAKGRHVSLLDVESPDMRQLPSICDFLAVDCMAVTPSLIPTIQKILGNRRLSSIKHVITFGEGLDWSVVKNMRRMFSEDVTVQSIYGASETAGVIAEYTIEPQIPIGLGLTPLGSPLDAERIRLEPLDGSEKLFEIVVVDNSVENYQFATNLTASRFNTTASGVTQWKSQDIVSVDDKGLLHYRGRLDDMIKINGLLVEPAEVESVLSSITGVQHAVVLPQKGNTNHSSLIAHLVVDEGTGLNRILDELKINLPRYLIPTEFVKHKEIPLTQRGKVDRTRLRSELFPRWRMENEFVSESNAEPTKDAKNALDPISRRLQAIWQEELNQSVVAVDATFAELGGDSLLAVGLLARIEREFKKRCTLTDFLNNQTVEKLTQFLIDSSDRSGFIEPLVYSSNGIGKTIFVLPSIEGVCSLPRGLMDEIQEEGSLVTLRMDLNHVPNNSRDHFERLAAEFVEVVRDYQPKGPYILIGYCFGGMLAFEIARQLELLKEKIELLTVIDAGRDPSLRWFDLLGQSRSAIRFIGNAPRWIKSIHVSKQWRSTFLKGLQKVQYAMDIGGDQSPAKQTKRYKKRPLRFLSLNDECYETILKLFDAYQAYQTQKFGGRIVLYRAKTRPLFHSLSPDFGWSSVTDQLEVFSIPGDHRSMVTGDGLAILTQDLRSKIRELKQTEASITNGLKE